jgi:hypothetical protein
MLAAVSTPQQVALGHNRVGGTGLERIEVLANGIYKVSLLAIFYIYSSFCICEKCRWHDAYPFIEKP